MSKMQNLQQALSRSTGKGTAPPLPEPVAARAPDAPVANAGRPPSRKGQVNISAWLDANYKSSLRLVQARKSEPLQNLIAEALNDLFTKYDVPTIRQK